MVPYLRDGRANTLDQAIRLHGGEAAATTSRYAGLTPPGGASGRPKSAGVS